MAQDYDVSLKLLFRRSNGVAIQRLLGESIVEWVNVELPRVSNPRVDMLGRTASGEYAHLELQSKNISDLEVRQADYYMSLYVALRKHVRSVVLYVGKAPLSMRPLFQTPDMTYRFRLVDIRELNGEELLASGDLGDAMMALLTEVDKEKVGSRVWPEIEKMEPGKREDTVTEFLIISGLRDLEDWVLERARKLMPLSIDVILENKVLGPAIRRRWEEIEQRAKEQGLQQGIQQGIQEGIQQGMQQGMQRGMQQGMQQGMLQGEVAMLRRLLESRFGPLPAPVLERLGGATVEELTAIADRAFAAATLEEAFRSS